MGKVHNTGSAPYICCGQANKDITATKGEHSDDQSAIMFCSSFVKFTVKYHYRATIMEQKAVIHNAADYYRFWTTAGHTDERCVMDCRLLVNAARANIPLRIQFFSSTERGISQVLLFIFGLSQLEFQWRVWNDLDCLWFQPQQRSLSGLCIVCGGDFRKSCQHPVNAQS